MTSLSRNWNTDENYWSLHPQMKTVELFKELHDRDRSKKKTESSMMMWAIALFVDPHEQNPWKTIDPTNRAKLIADEYLGDSKFPWEASDIQELIEEYKERCLSVAEKALIQLEKKIADRANFIDKTSYSMDYYSEDTGKVIKGTADQLDKMMANTVKIYQQLEQVKDMLDKEAIEGQTRGGVQESASETGLL